MGKDVEIFRLNLRDVEIFRLNLRVDALPVSQPRPRVVNGIAISAPAKHPVHTFKAAIRSAAEDAYHGDPIDCAIVLSCEFFFPRPGSRKWKTRPMPREFKSTRPDFDNLIKGVCDALTGIVWTDDNRIVDCRITKWLVAGTMIGGKYSEERPGCDITVVGLEK